MLNPNSFGDPLTFLLAVPADCLLLGWNAIKCDTDCAVAPCGVISSLFFQDLKCNSQYLK